MHYFYSCDPNHTVLFKNHISSANVKTVWVSRCSSYVCVTAPHDSIRLAGFCLSISDSPLAPPTSLDDLSVVCISRAVPRWPPSLPPGRLVPLRHRTWFLFVFVFSSTWVHITGSLS